MQIDNIYFVRKLNNPSADRVLATIADFKCQAQKVGLAIVDTESFLTSNSLVIAVGGDGTMIHAMKTAAKYGCYVVGINLGKRGFLTEIDTPTNLLTTILEGKFSTNFRHLIKVKINGGADYALAINEVSIANLYTGKILGYDLKIGDVQAGFHRADSVIIATPTGSTAYALSAGGAILDPDLKVVEIVPVAPLTMSSRPLIVSSFSKPIIVSASADEGEDLMVRVDGQDVFRGNRLEVAISYFEQCAKVLHSPEWNFYETLSSKLNWNVQT